MGSQYRVQFCKAGYLGNPICSGYFYEL